MDTEEELVVGLPPATTARASDVETPRGNDLSDRAKVWFAIGPGRSGKTTLLRYIAEQISATGHEAIFAALDPQNRSLKGFLDGVLEPPTNDAAAVGKWLERLLRHMMAGPHSGLLDLGGGDTSLGWLLDAVPELAEAMDGAGVSPVAIYTLGPRVDDLASLATFDARGFQPEATALLLNEGLADPTLPREEAFARVIRHSAFRAAIGRGAVQLGCPDSIRLLRQRSRPNACILVMPATQYSQKAVRLVLSAHLTAVGFESGWRQWKLNLRPFVLGFRDK